MNYDKPTYLRRPLGIRKPPAQPLPDRAPVVCKYCGSEQLQWKETPSGFRLFELHGERHFCAAMRQQADYARQKQVNAAPTHAVVSAIVEQMRRQLDTTDDGDRTWSRDEIMSLLESASLNALLKPGAT